MTEQSQRIEKKQPPPHSARSGAGMWTGAVVWACVFGAALWVLPAQAAYVAAGELSAKCRSDESADIAACIHYIAGVMDYHILLESLGTAPNIKFCVPREVSAEQAAVIVMAYLRMSPEHDAFVAASAVPLALQKAYPCRTPQQRDKK